MNEDFERETNSSLPPVVDTQAAASTHTTERTNEFCLLPEWLRRLRSNQGWTPTMGLSKTPAN